MEELNAYDMGLAGIGFTANAANERIAELEEENAAWEAMCKNAFKKLMKTEQLVRDMYTELNHVRDDVFLMDYIEKRMVELGIEVER